MRGSGSGSDQRLAACVGDWRERPATRSPSSRVTHTNSLTPSLSQAASRDPRAGFSGGPQFPDTLHLVLLAAAKEAALLRRGFDLLAARGGKGAQGFLLLS